jgi:hypothetical protein
MKMMPRIKNESKTFVKNPQEDIMRSCRYDLYANMNEKGMQSPEITSMEDHFPARH